MNKDFNGDMVKVLMQENQELKEQLSGKSKHFYKMSPEDRCRHDPLFKSLVDTMFDFIYNNQYSPTELRDACMQASIKYEFMRKRGGY